MPHVSVILPVYNCRPYLEAAIRSVLDQTYRDFELIIVNDGSTDGSDRVIAALAGKDARIQVISRPNTGIVGALNDGLAAARGEWIARMDGDDLAEPHRFDRQIAFLRENPRHVALGTGAWTMDARDRIVGRFDAPLETKGITDQLLRGNGAALLHPSVIFSRQALREAGSYLPEFCRAEDLDLYFRLLPLGPVANLPERLLRYRQHAGSTNFAQRARQRTLVQSIVDRERSRRGLPAFDVGSAPGPSDFSRPELYRHWACNSFGLGYRSTGIHYALRALWLAPRHIESWRTLRYVCQLARAPQS